MIADAHGLGEVARHLAKTLGVQALSGIKGLSVLPQGMDAAADAVRKYQEQYSPSMDLSPEGQQYIQHTVAPLYNGVKGSAAGKFASGLSSDYGQGVQQFSDLAGKYLGPQAAGAVGATGDVLPYLMTPEGMLGKDAVATAAKSAPELARAYDGSSLHSLANEGYAAKQRQGAAISVNKATDVGHPTAGLIGFHPDALVIDAHDPSDMSHVGRMVAEPSEDGSMLVGRGGGNGMGFGTDGIVDPAYRGQGIGPKMLRSGVDHAHSNGMDWGSDTQLSPGGVAMYMKLQEQGYPMEFNPTASITDDHYLKSGDGKPVLTVPKPTDPDTADLNEPTTFDPNSYIGSQAHAEGGLIGDELAKLVSHIAEKGGITKDMKTGAMPTSGYAVSVQKGLETKTPGQPTGHDIQNFMQTNQGPLSQPNEHFGVWKNPETGEHFMDVSHVEPDFATAVQKAKANNQLAIYDLGTGETIPTTPDYMHFEHYSNLNTPTANLDPAFYGTGMKGAEAKRGGTKVVSLYPAGATPEDELANKTKYRVTVPASSMYDMSNDPQGLRVNAPSYSDAEDAVKDAGYAGYHTPDHANPLMQGQARMFGPTPAVRVGPGAAEAAPADEDLSQGFAEGGEVAPALDDLGALVAKYADGAPNTHAAQLASTAADTGSVTYNPTSGEVHNSGYLVPSEPSRSVALGGPPDADEVHDFMLQNHEAFQSDPKAVLHVETGDDGSSYMHVAHHEPDFESAMQAAQSFDSPGVQELHTGTQIPTTPAAPAVSKGKQAAVIDVPYLSKTYGALEPQTPGGSMQTNMRNTPEAVQSRVDNARAFLAQPTEPWTPQTYAFDRSPIQDALQGWPGVEQSQFPRYQPTSRTDLSHLETLTTPENRDLIKQQIARGLPLGGETFYASLYPVAVEAEAAGIPRDQITRWIQGVAPGSARNSIYNQNAVGNMLHQMNARGIPLTPENVQAEMDAFKQKYGVGLPLMNVHRQGTQDVLEGGINPRDRLLAGDQKGTPPINPKIPTYGSQQAGDFAHSTVLDTHEAQGQTLASPFHPYFAEQGGFKPAEYGPAEQNMLSIANEMGIAGGQAQAGRWFGGGELTGLLSPRGDALDMLERQSAYSLGKAGMPVTPQAVRSHILNQIRGTHEVPVLPWYRKSDMPDFRTR
jgi:GNAT superfamily N-acetyltransferase